MDMWETAASGPTPLRRLRFVVALLAPLLLIGCLVYEDRGDRGAAQRSPGVTREVPLRVAKEGGRTLAFVPVSIEGTGPFLFALDTGASISVVDDDVADRAGLERTGERRVVSGILDAGQVPVARVERWELGSIVLDPAEVAVIDLGTPRGGDGIQGLLGSDVLSGFGSITVDYDEGMLEIPAP
ncbi:retropepsin-like aspartic protease [Streptomyces sp. HNM0645]|uniref:retropepsin-like aspartic protease n=1 Tax=Streptomyces sp. HNM0645 TaxID=2782343 RepID=UPI0024B8010E|nr:retropepsin-like aspartic protease [Streptomyces sp. HNM0645]MDI9889220.1 retropepsin-like aspartic protease [Streptomyces sp. HNM0645]